MKILTGVGKNPHVTSKEFRRIIESIAGQGSYIIGCGENMVTELTSNNLLKIRDGAMIHHGNVSTVDVYDEIEISNGAQGMKRIDLVVNRYTKNAKTQIETNEWVVLQGAPAETNPTVPEYVVGNLQEGDLVDDCPFCQIVIDGINVTEVKGLLRIIPSVPELQQGLTELNSNLKDKVAVIGNYGSAWNLTTLYKNVGNALAASAGNNLYYKIATGNDGYIEVLQGGLYLISMTAYFAGQSVSVGAIGYARFTVNGNTATDMTQQTSCYHYGAGGSRPNLATVKYLEAGSRIRMEVSASANSALQSDGSERLMVAKIF